MAAKKLKDKGERKVTRRFSIRSVKQSFLIVCEGMNTEPDYFNAFRLTSAHVHAVGEGLGTLSLVEEAIAIRQEELRKGKVYDQYWVVFDKDDYTAQDFNEAIRLGEVSGFRIAYSNQAFEFWFILHFVLHRGPMHRREYAERLTQLTGIPYSKKAGFAGILYNILYNRMDTATRNAETVLGEFQGVPPASAESTTTVFRLVSELRRFL